MIDKTQIQEHAEVVGSDGKHVGKVDHLDSNDRVKLVKQDPEAQGKHHFIALSLIERVQDGKLWLSKPAADIEREWQAA